MFNWLRRLTGSGNHVCSRYPEKSELCRTCNGIEGLNLENQIAMCNACDDFETAIQRAKRDFNWEPTQVEDMAVSQ